MLFFKFSTTKNSNTRVILDATEIPIQIPQILNTQSIVYTKVINTLKTIIVVPLRYNFFFNDFYSGSASDR